MRRAISLSGVLLAALLFCYPQHTLAQTGTGEVNGTVMDPSGAYVPGAKMILTNQATGVESRTTTTTSGVFHFLNVLPGTYDLRVEAAGFKVAAFPPFDVGVSQLVTRDAQLTVGALNQSVEVSTQPPLLQASSTELGGVLTAQPVHDLPLNGRNFMELLLLQPGATPLTTAQGGSDIGTPDGGVIAVPSAQVARPSFEGSQGRSVVYYTDGIVNTDFRANVPGVPPNPDLIQEFDVVSHDTRSDFGGVIGAAVNLVTKSGDNQFHGSAFEFVRNNDFDARNTFADVDTSQPANAQPGPPPFHQNQFGADIGGPIKHNRTFFYGGYSGWRYIKPAQGFIRIPTPAELSGDFSQNPFGDILPIYNPYSTQPDPNQPGSYIRQPFMCDASGNPLPPNGNGTQTPTATSSACNKLPSSLLSTPIQSLFQTYTDSPNLTGNPRFNYLENQPSTNSENDASVRVDHRLSDHDNLFFRWSEIWDSATSFNTPKYHDTTSFYDHNEGGGWTHVFSPNLVLDARGGNLSGPVNIYYLSKLGASPEAKFFSDLSQWQTLGLNLSPPYGGFGFSAYGEEGIVDPDQDDFRNNQGWNFTVNVNWIKGAHNFRMGFAYLHTTRIQLNEFEEFTFTNDITSNPELPGTTGNSLASALLGLPGSFGGQLNTHSKLDINLPEWALYVQDEWKVKPRLSINWGLRWDVDPLAAVVGPRTSDAVSLAKQQYIIGLASAPPLCSMSPTSDPCLPQALSSVPDNGSIVFGGNHLQVPHAEYDQVGPRIGIAWELAPNTVFRAGYGLYFDALIARSQTAQNDLEQLAWPYTTGFSGSANAPNSAGVPAGGSGNPLIQLTSIEGSFPSPVPAPTPWTPSGWADDPRDKDPYSHEWNVEIQRQFGRNLMLSAAYVGSVSRRLPYTGPNADAASQPSPPGTPLTTIDSLRPMPYLEGQPLYYTEDIGKANYNALQLKAVRRFSGGLQSQISFTYGRSLDNSSGYYDVENGSDDLNGVQNFFDPRSNHSVSGYDTPLILTWYTVYNLPAGQGKRWLNKGPACWILGDWQVNYILSANSGQPYTLAPTGGDIANIFGTDANGFYGTYMRPDQVGNPKASVPQGYEFNPFAYAVPASGTFGNVGRNSLRSPAVFDTDFSLFKNIPLGRSESRQLQIRFEFFNLFNDMNWSTPSATINGCTPAQGLGACGGAGLVTSLAHDPREIQFGARIVF